MHQAQKWVRHISHAPEAAGEKGNHHSRIQLGAAVGAIQDQTNIEEGVTNSA